jgi:hypothetical protein
MEKFQELRENAKKKIGIADHMLTQTYPLVQDPKLLLSVLENVFLALTNSVGSVLYYERLFKRIPPFQENFDSKYNIFRARIVNRYNIDKKYVDILKDIKEMLLQHRKSQMEFTRKDKLVICDEEYRMKTLSINDIKEYIETTKEFIDISQQITKKDEKLFLKS